MSTLSLTVSGAPRSSASTGRRGIAQTRVVVFLTRGMSLERWHRAGILERELAFYQALRARVGALELVSYGDRGERGFLGQLGGLRLLANRWRLDSNLYSLAAPLMHASAIRQASVLRTHQLNGAWAAAIAKSLFGKKLIVRCGYIWSAFLERESRNPWRRGVVRRLEAWVLKAADRVVVATEPDRDYLIQRYGIAPGKIAVIPNYVDVERFRPMPSVERQPGLICFVGRLEEQKNPIALLEAMRGLAGAKLLMIGDGPLKASLQRKARERSVPVEFLGNVANDRLPELLNRAQLFALPSRYEGNPKALLEAMACGLPVIAARVPGVDQVIRHGKTGYVCEPGWQALHAGIRELLADPQRRAELGAAARESVVQSCSLERIVEQELELLHEVTQGNGRD